jgi:hypothetical protein
VKGAGSVPTRAGGQFFAFAQRDIPPPELGQVVEDAAADDSASDDKYPDVALHGILFPMMDLILDNASAFAGRRQPDTGAGPSRYLKATGAGEARRFLVVRWI